MIKILRYSKGSRALYVLAPLFKMIEAVMELIVPLIVASIIDRGILSGDRHFIILLSIQLLVLGLAGLIFSITAQYFAARAAVTTVKASKQALFDKIQNLSFTQLDSIGGNTLITRLTSDMDSVQNGINLTLRLLLRSPFVVAGACIMAYRVDGFSSLVFAGTVPVLALIVITVMAVTISLFGKVRGALDKVLVSVRESVTGARVIRAFCKEEDTVKEFSMLNNSLNHFQLLTGRISALMNPLTQAVVNIGIAVLIYVGALRVNAGLITAGSVVALYNYMSQILVELVKFANLVISVAKSLACAKRIEKVLDLPDEKSVIDSEDKSDYYIEFRNVTFSYSKDAEPALKNISFTVKKGEKIGIIGSTGSGKTTLMSLLCGFYKPDKGEIFVGGKNICSYSEKELSDMIAYSEQKPCVFKGTVRSNLLLGKPDATDEDIEKALEISQALVFVKDKENGFDSVCEQNGRNFSGGQRQRLTVARALIKNSPILILDDSFSALDYATEAALKKGIDETVDATLFIISQRTGSIMECDKIIVLEDGCADVGTHISLLESNETYREIHLTQFEEEAEAV